MEGKTASPSTPPDPDSDMTLSASFSGSDGDSDYIEPAENSPMSLANILDLAGHISKLEVMHEVSEGKIDAITQPTVILSHTEELEITELADADNNPPINHQDNGATPPVNTQPYPPNSPPEDTLVAKNETPPRPHFKAGDADLQVHTGDLPDIHLLGADYIFYGVYRDWVHQKSRRPLGWRNCEIQ